MGSGTPRKNKAKPKRRMANGSAGALRNNRKMVDTVMNGQSKNVLNESFKRGEKQGFTRSLMATMWVLHTKFGYGAKRIEPFLAELADFCNTYLEPNTRSVRRGEFHGLTVEDLRDEMFDVYGFYINLTTGHIYRVDDKPFLKSELPPDALEESEPTYLDNDFWVSTTPEVRAMIIKEAKDNKTTVEDLLEYKIHQLYMGDKKDE